MQQIELVARLIRSKGVGVFFVTHAPSDVPGEVLGQLGNRVQHALRAFTPDDLEIVRATAETFPTTERYDVEEELTALGTGEALITALDLKGRPLPTVRTMMRPPIPHGPGGAVGGRRGGGLFDARADLRRRLGS
jgi:DNA helicase HerA-like ATPase